MSDCGVCIGGFGDGEAPEFYESSTPKARKEHECDECRRTIHVGEKYRYIAGKWDGDFETFKICLLCEEIRRSFKCDDGVTPIGYLMEDMNEALFPNLTTACFDRLQTPEAKQHLRALWMAWKGLKSA